MLAVRSRIAAGDLDGDGFNDLVALAGDDQVVLRLQSAATPGTFSTPRRRD
jgi:hypothetical protein